MVKINGGAEEFFFFISHKVVKALKDDSVRRLWKRTIE